VNRASQKAKRPDQIGAHLSTKISVSQIKVLSRKTFVFYKDFFSSVFSIISLLLDFQNESGGVDRGSSRRAVVCRKTPQSPVRSTSYASSGATAAEISQKETVSSAFLRGLQFQEYPSCT
jgi:hypothetical protein